MATVVREAASERFTLAAAGVAFYAFLALFPALWVCVSIYGLVLDPTGLEARIDWLYGVLPPIGAQVIDGELRGLASAPGPSLTAGFVLGFGVASWSSVHGIRVLIAACNSVYRSTERRSFVSLTLLASVFVAGSVVVIALAVWLLVVVPALAARFEIPFLPSSWIRWPLLGLVFATFVACLYRFAPNRKVPADWRWLSWGSVGASMLWLVVSGVFSQVVRFGALSRIYGALAGTAVLLIWLYLSVLIILLGAKLNEELEAEREAGSWA